MKDLKLNLVLCVVVTSAIALSVFAFCAKAQDMHDSVHQIMLESNAMCMIHGVVDEVEYNHEMNYKYLSDIVVEPDYYIWSEKCDQFYENHFTEYEIPELRKFHNGISLTVTYLEVPGNWEVYSVSPNFASIAFGGK